MIGVDLDGVLNTRTLKNEQSGSFKKSIFNLIFLPNFSKSFFTCQWSIFSGVKTRLGLSVTLKVFGNFKKKQKSV